MLDRFHRVKGRKGRSFEGTGIGLALVREYVVLHAGDVEVESAVGEGSTFTVTLPFGNRHLDLNKIDVSAAQSAAPSSRAYVDALEPGRRWFGRFRKYVAAPSWPRRCRPSRSPDDRRGQCGYARLSGAPALAGLRHHHGWQWARGPRDHQGRAARSRAQRCDDARARWLWPHGDTEGRP